jgi:hypothetical protein
MNLWYYGLIFYNSFQFVTLIVLGVEHIRHEQ